MSDLTPMDSCSALDLSDLPSHAGFSGPSSSRLASPPFDPTLSVQTLSPVVRGGSGISLGSLDSFSSSPQSVLRPRETDATVPGENQQRHAQHHHQHQQSQQLRQEPHKEQQAEQQQQPVQQQLLLLQQQQQPQHQEHTLRRSCSAGLEAAQAVAQAAGRPASRAATHKRVLSTSSPVLDPYPQLSRVYYHSPSSDRLAYALHHQSISSSSTCSTSSSLSSTMSSASPSNSSRSAGGVFLWAARVRMEKARQQRELTSPSSESHSSSEASASPSRN